MKALQIVSLWIVGLTFIFSGFVKAVDPAGFATQITDYLYAFHIEYLKTLSFSIAIGLAAFEFLIGTHLILQLRIKQVAWPLLIFMIYFTLLTLVIAIFNPVSDCGCFGEAVKLTNWQTFGKNLILLPLSFIIFKARKQLPSPISAFRGTVITALHACFIISIACYASYDSPIFDFRPYKIGVNIPHAMSIPAGAEQPEYDTRFIMEKNGVKQEFGVTDYPYTDSTWVFVSSKTIVLKEGYQPAIKDFHINDLNNIESSHLLLNSQEPVFVMISPKLSKADTTNMTNMVKLHLLAQEKGFHFYCLTASDNSNIDSFEKTYNVGFNYLTADETILKTITRSNPGLMMIYDGTIVGKWNVNRIQDASIFSNPLEGALTLHRKRSNALMLFACFFFILAGTSIIFRYKS